MSKFIKFLLIYILIYFIVDFGTGFSWDFKYWASVNGPLIGLVLYSLSGLFFGWLIFKKNIKEKRLFIIVLIYGLLLELLLFKNPFLAFPNIFLGLPLVAVIYSLIVFLPKWIVEKSIKNNFKKLLPLIIIWIFLAILSYFNNPHR